MEVDSVATAVRWALSYLGCVRHMAHKPAIVLDIDGTVIWNAPGGNGSKCVLHFKSLVDACYAAGVEVFFVTARPESTDNRAHTERQLQRCALRYKKLYMMPPRQDYARYKHRAREDIALSEYTVLLSIGDQFADVSLKANTTLSDSKLYVGQIGDNGSYGIKLPAETY